MRLEWALGYSTSIWERSITGGSCRQESLPPRNQNFPGAFSFPYLSSKGQVRVRFGKLLAILTPPRYHPFLPDVSHLCRVFPSSPSLPLCCIPQPARLDRFSPCRPAEGPRWSPPVIVEEDQGSDRPHQPGRLTDKSPLPDSYRSSRTSPVRSLKRSRRTSPVGSLGRRRKIVQTD